MEAPRVSQPRLGKEAALSREVGLGDLSLGEFN